VDVGEVADVLEAHAASIFRDRVLNIHIAKAKEQNPKYDEI
jgi:hypothetical protein